MHPVVFLAWAALAYGCAQHDGHVHDIRAQPSAPLTPPTTPLEWGDVNVLHTTDSHGWLLGHQKKTFPEPNYSGDFGDLSSFVHHMKNLAAKKNVDLLLVDTGDLHDGTGLSDGFPSNKFFAELPYDALAIGNHELYVYNNTLDMHHNFAPKFKGRYLSSNVNITFTNEKNETINEPVGSRFAKFKTKRGRKVTAFGVLFNFAGNDKNTHVQKVADMVKEPWFAEAIKEEPDFFLLLGHMPVQKDNWPLVFNTIRAIHATTPILIFGGHTHIRDCVQLDNRSMSLESGRYMETVGWMSAKLDKKGSKDPIKFSRRYLDPNRVTYEFHTNRKDKTFDTDKGKGITAGLLRLAKKFNLDFKFGTAPHDFTITQAPYPSNNSLLSLFIEEAIPVATAINNTRANIPNLMIANSGSQRFDIYAGPFTKNDELTASPFVNHILFIESVRAGDAKSVLLKLNNAGSENRRRGSEERDAEEYAKGYVGKIYKNWLEEMHKRSGPEKRQSGNQTLGYVTKDSCPGIGDDIIHTPLSFNSAPPFIGSKPPQVADDAPIDLVFVDFIQSQLLKILNTVQTVKNYTQSDIKQYSPILTDQVLGLYARQKWN